jgi:NDP-sugar pyrophosphorylase family protein
MIPVHETPLLEYIVKGLKYAGFRDFIFVVGYLKKQVIDYFEDGAPFNINIEYIEQKELNGTGGALLLCEELIQEQHFFLTWGDILIPYHIYKEVYNLFKKEQDDFILVGNYQENLQKGCVLFCEGKYCTKMIEKPKNKNLSSNLNNCGVFILSTEIFDMLKKIKPSERGELEIPDAISRGIQEEQWNVRVIKMEPELFRGDFGDPTVYKKLNKTKTWLDRLKDPEATE